MIFLRIFPASLEKYTKTHVETKTTNTKIELAPLKFSRYDTISIFLYLSNISAIFLVIFPDLNHLNSYKAYKKVFVSCNSPKKKLGSVYR